MLHIEQLYVQPDITVLDAMKKLDETGRRILFIAPGGKLQAVVTDGDLRKLILRGGKLTDPVQKAANYHPYSLPLARRGEAKRILEEKVIDALPLLDQSGCIADIVFAGGLDVDNRRRAGLPVVIMAGGLALPLHQNFAKAAHPGGGVAHCRAHHQPVLRVRLQ